jgi:hypothetical protein
MSDNQPAPQNHEEARNKAVFRRFHHALNSGDPRFITRTIDQVVAPDALFHPSTPVDPMGRQALEQLWTTLLHAFPDLHVETEDLIAEGDRIACRNTVTGTHQGDFQGLPPTGRSVSYHEMFVVRFADGLVAESWGVVDVLTQMRQLGLMPDSFGPVPNHVTSGGPAR